MVLKNEYDYSFDLCDEVERYLQHTFDIEKPSEYFSECTIESRSDFRLIEAIRRTDNLERPGQRGFSTLKIVQVPTEIIPYCCIEEPTWGRGEHIKFNRIEYQTTCIRQILSDLEIDAATKLRKIETLLDYCATLSL